MRRIILVASVFLFLGLSMLTAQLKKNVQSSTIYSREITCPKNTRMPIQTGFILWIVARNYLLTFINTEIS